MTNERTIKCHTPKLPERESFDEAPVLKKGDDVVWADGAMGKFFPCKVEKVSGDVITVSTDEVRIEVDRKDIWMKLPGKS